MDTTMRILPSRIMMILNSGIFCRSNSRWFYSLRLCDIEAYADSKYLYAMGAVLYASE